MHDLLDEWRSALDWRFQTGLEDDGEPAGGQLMKDAENRGDPNGIQAAETSLESELFQPLQCLTDGSDHLSGGTRRRCKDWDAVNPIFAPQDGGDPSLRSDSTAEGIKVLLAALIGDDEDRDGTMPNTLMRSGASISISPSSKAICNGLFTGLGPPRGV